MSTPSMPAPKRLPDASRESEVAVAESFFGPRGSLETVERL